MIENIFYSIPSEPGFCQVAVDREAADRPVDASLPCIGSAKDLIERHAKKTAHGTAEPGQEQISKHRARILACMRISVVLDRPGESGIVVPEPRSMSLLLIGNDLTH